MVTSRSVQNARMSEIKILG